MILTNPHQSRVKNRPQMASIKSMHLVQILLPLADNQGRKFPDAIIQKIKDLILERFGGWTAFTRAPAEGIYWSESQGCVYDTIVVIEVMDESLNRKWWHDFRLKLEDLLAQEEVILRAHAIEQL